MPKYGCLLACQSFKWAVAGSGHLGYCCVFYVIVYVMFKWTPKHASCDCFIVFVF